MWRGAAHYTSVGLLDDSNYFQIQMTILGFWMAEKGEDRRKAVGGFAGVQPYRARI